MKILDSEFNLFDSVVKLLLLLLLLMILLLSVTSNCNKSSFVFILFSELLLLFVSIKIFLSLLSLLFSLGFISAYPSQLIIGQGIKLGLFLIFSLCKNLSYLYINSSGTKSFKISFVKSSLHFLSGHFKLTTLEFLISSFNYSLLYSKQKK